MFDDQERDQDRGRNVPLAQSYKWSNTSHSKKVTLLPDSHFFLNSLSVQCIHYRGCCKRNILADMQILPAILNGTPEQATPVTSDRCPPFNS
jgi:hypothetical protein